MIAVSLSGLELVATGGLVAGAGLPAFVDAETFADGDFDLRPNNAISGLQNGG